MKSNLFDFGKEKLDDNEKKITEEELKEKATQKNIDVDSAKNIYDKYKDCSKEELLEKLHSVISNGKKDGSITNDKINQTVKQLSPFLNENQKNFLNSILQDIND